VGNPALTGSGSTVPAPAHWYANGNDFSVASGQKLGAGPEMYVDYLYSPFTQFATQYENVQSRLVSIPQCDVLATVRNPDRVYDFFCKSAQL